MGLGIRKQLAIVRCCGLKPRAPLLIRVHSRLFAVRFAALRRGHPLAQHRDVMRIVCCQLLLTALLTGATSAQQTPTHPAATANPQSANHKPRSVLPGKQPDGSVLLPNQWSLRPAGRQVELADFPINVAVHPGGPFAAVLHTGDSDDEIRVVDVLAAKVVSRMPIHEAFYGLEFSSDGSKLFCSGAGDEVVHAFGFRNGELSDHIKIKLREAAQRAVPAGLAVDRAGARLFVANVWADRVTRVDLGPTPKAADILLRPDAAPTSIAPVPAGNDFEDEAALKREEASLYQTSPNDTFPYACRLDEKRQRLYVSLWAQSAVAVIDLKSAQVIARWPAQEHPCEMALTRSGRLLFVANSARNTVSVLNTESGQPVEIISAALYPQSPPGSTPN